MIKNKLLNRINNKHIYIVMLVAFYASLLPILILAFYNYPCADDFSASDTVHLAWVNTGSILAVVKAAWDNVVYNYMEWSGVFMSVFWTSLQPGIFGEKYYGITTVITVVLFIIGGFYLGHVIFDRYVKADKYLSRCIVLLYLFISIQCMPDGNEALFWHAGAVNYTWAFSFLLMLLGVVLSIHKEVNDKKRIIKVLLACILAVFVGGGNFITALQGSIWMIFLVIAIWISDYNERNKKVIKYIKKEMFVFLPVVVLIVSFAVSVLAPGNNVRIQTSTGYGAIKSILISFYYLFNNSLETWITWPLMVALLMTIPFMWKIAKNTDYSFKSLGIVTMICVCFTAAAYTPSLYAQGDVEAGRLYNTIYFIGTFLMFVVLFYILGWIDKRLYNHSNKENVVFSNQTKIYIMGLSVFWLIASALTIMIDQKIYIGSNAAYAIVSGQASDYKIENEIRLELLNSNEQNVSLPGFSNPPDLLSFQDITVDENEWINQVMALYYEKESVRRE